MSAAPEDVGVSGKVVLGALIVVPAEQQLEMLETLKGLPEAEAIVHLSRSTQGLTVWFSGPRQAGDFVTHWESATHLGPRHESSNTPTPAAWSIRGKPPG